jgi:methylated-DNA-protein-cysteine methyltransferase-like protein
MHTLGDRILRFAWASPDRLALRACSSCWTLIRVARVQRSRSTPRAAGTVATYGQVAALAGIVNGHRVAARAMRECPEGLPWQRVLGKKDARRAQVNIADSEHAQLQRSLLEREGVCFDDEGRTRLEQFGWLPSELPSKQASREKRARQQAKAKSALKT